MNDFIKGFREGMKKFAANVTYVTNFILLSIVYILGVGPTSVIAKIFGKHFLYMGKKKSSNWIERKEKIPSKESLERIF